MESASTADSIFGIHGIIGEFAVFGVCRVDASGYMCESLTMREGSRAYAVLTSKIKTEPVLHT